MRETHQPLEEFAWLKSNLELQLEDIEFEKKGKRIALYFDTADVQRAVVGLKSYYAETKLKVTLFHSERTLVDCLIASGLLGPFCMVPPHFSEFYHKVDDGFDVGSTRNWDQEAKRFLKDAGLIRKDNIPLEQLDDNEVRQLTAEEISKASLWFRAINCLLPWHRRLNTWLERDLLVLDSQALSVREVVSADDFKALKQKFDDVRTGVSVNNFVDASAVTYLINLTKELNEGTSDIVPRFFLPPDEHTFKPVLDQANLHHRLSCRHPETGRECTIFRDTDYYVFKLTFRSAISHLGPAAHLSSEEKTKELRKLHDIITNSIEATKGFAPAEAKEYALSLNDVYQGKSLAELIEHLQGFAFIDQNRLKTEADTEFLAIIQQMAEVADVVASQREIHENERVQHAVIQEFKKRTKDLDDSLRAFRWVSLMWEPVHSRGTAVLRKRLQNLDEQDRGDYFRELGLLRYGFPTGTHKKISNILSNLSSEMSDAVLTGTNQALRAYVNGRRDVSGGSNHLIVATAILIAQRLEPQLFDLLRKSKSLKHSSLRTVYAELLFRVGQRTDDNKLLEEAERILRDLRVEFEHLPPGHEKSHLAVGLAYLCYRAWLTHPEIAGDDNSEQTTETAETTVVVSAPLSERIQLATTYANYAYQNLANQEVSTKAYALNQYLFYAVEGRVGIPFAELESTARLLLRYRMQTHVWQFRFDDTLARYYHRRLESVSEDLERKKLLDLAVLHSRLAFEKSDDDEEVKNFYMYLSQRSLKPITRFGADAP
ncbi:MAG TPA: hypothetical protein VN956_08355 [Pyrinomonadaceae bacterium]|nr:hypothetical protein [Pyrinomonadaceae bacterium]